MKPYEIESVGEWVDLDKIIRIGRTHYIHEDQAIIDKPGIASGAKTTVYFVGGDTMEIKHIASDTYSRSQAMQDSADERYKLVEAWKAAGRKK